MNGPKAVFALPDRIRGLEDLAYNLWWSWSAPARELFRSLDLQAWRESGHNPIRVLAMLPANTRCRVQRGITSSWLATML